MSIKILGCSKLFCVVFSTVNVMVAQRAAPKFDAFGEANRVTETSRGDTLSLLPRSKI